MKKFIIPALSLVLSIPAIGAEVRPLTEKEKMMIEVSAKKALKDPDSAKFFWQDYRSGEIYCAHVNAKNAYGGYAGKALLMVGVKNDAAGKIVFAESIIHSGEMEQMMKPICIDAGYDA